MSEAVIVSTARTPIGKAFRGAFNMTHGANAGGHVVKYAARARRHRSGRGRGRGARLRDAGESDGLEHRTALAIRAGTPVTVSGVTVNRFCSSGLQTIAMAAQRIIAGEADCIVAAGWKASR